MIALVLAGLGTIFENWESVPPKIVRQIESMTDSV
jgi:hypothetical protein